MIKYKVEYRASNDQGKSWYTTSKIIEANNIDDAIRKSDIWYKLITNVERI